MDFGTIISAALTGGTGGIIGVIGNVANTIMSLKQQAQEHDFQIKMMPLQMQMLASKASAQIEQTKADVAKVVEQTAGEAFTASQKADSPTGQEHRWVLDVKGLVRPVCLLLLGIGTVAIYTSGDPTLSMKEYITQNVVCDFSMALSWYFGARASANIMAGFKSKAGT
jgi:hypothetical protein